MRELQTSWEKRGHEYTAALGKGVYDYRLEWVGGVYDYRLEWGGGVRELQTRVGWKVLWIGGCALVRVLKMDELCTSSQSCENYRLAGKRGDRRIHCCAGKSESTNTLLHLEEGMQELQTRVGGRDARITDWRGREGSTNTLLRLIGGCKLLLRRK